MTTTCPDCGCAELEGPWIHPKLFRNVEVFRACPKCGCRESTTIGPEVEKFKVEIDTLPDAFSWLRTVHSIYQSTRPRPEILFRSHIYEDFQYLEHDRKEGSNVGEVIVKILEGITQGTITIKRRENACQRSE